MIVNWLMIVLDDSCY